MAFEMTTQDWGPAWHSWNETLRTRVRVTTALVRREMRAHFGESRIGYLWAVFEVLLHLGGFVLVFTFLFKRSVPLGTSTALFLLTGIVPYFLYMKLASYISGAIGSNRSLLNLPPVKPVDVIVARVVLQATTYLFVSFFLFVCLYLGGINGAVPSNLFSVMEACLLAICLGTGIGMINIVILSFFDRWMTIFGITTFPLWMFSGIWFLPEQVPQPLRDYMLYNPILHIVLLFRTAFYPDYHAVFLDVPYAILVATLAVALGLALMQVARRSVLEPLH